MKKILLLVAVLSFNLSNAQSWTKSSGGNAFDGKYKTSSVLGNGSEYPYKKPFLVVNKFEDSGINFYIEGSGFWNTSIDVLFSFDNDSGVIYESTSHSLSSDSKTIFLKDFIDKKTKGVLSNYEVIDKIKKASKLYVRISGRYGNNNLSFSLRGSTVAINYVVPNLDDIITDVVLERTKELEAKKERFRISEERDSLVTSYATRLIKSIEGKKVIDISSVLYTTKKLIDLEVNDEDNRFFKDNVTLEVRPSKHPTLGLQMFTEYGYVEIYVVFPDGTEEIVKKNLKVSMDSPLFDE
jgi:hypothetical protein